MRACVVLSFLVLTNCKTDAAPAPTAPEPAATTQPETPPSEPEASAPKGPVINAELDTSAETVGPIRQEMSAEAVIAALGEPDAKPQLKLEEVTGEFVADWSWADEDLTLTMSLANIEGPDIRVSAITCGRNCAFGLPWGLKIGSTRAEVEAIYGEHFDREFTTEETYIAGSVYGGTFYTLEDGKVIGVFIGAGAE